MKNAMGYFILCRVWDYLLNNPAFDRNTSDALTVVSDLRTKFIYEGDKLDPLVKFLVDCAAWKLHMEGGAR